MAIAFRPLSSNQPTLRQIAIPLMRDRWASATRLGGITPERLDAILREGERGRVEEWADLCELMLETDAHLSAVYGSAIEAVAGAPFEVVPGASAGDVVRPIDEAAADLCRSMLEGIPDIEDAFGFVLNAKGPGYSASELEWTRRGGAWVVGDILWRHPRRFLFDDDWKLRLYDGAAYGQTGLELEPNKWILFTPKPLGSYPTRAGTFRKCAWPWLFKRWTMKFWVSACERLGTPLLIGTIPVNADADVQTEFREKLENLTARQAAVVGEGTTIQALDTKIREGSATFKELLQFLNSEQSKAILGNTLTTEVQDVGARATATTQFDSSQLPRMKADGRRLAGAFERQVFAPTLRFNLHLFGGQMPAVPKLVFKVEPQPAIEPIQEWHAKAKLIRRNDVRERLNLSKLTDAEGGSDLLELLDQPAPGMPGFSATPDASADVAVLANPVTDLERNFQVGDVVHVVGPAHEPGQVTGRIVEVTPWAYGIVFDGQESLGVHHWYADAELAPAGGGQPPAPPLPSAAPMSRQPTAMSRPASTTRTTSPTSSQWTDPLETVLFGLSGVRRRS